MWFGVGVLALFVVYVATVRKGRRAGPLRFSRDSFLEGPRPKNGEGIIGRAGLIPEPTSIEIEGIWVRSSLGRAEILVKRDDRWVVMLGAPFRSELSALVGASYIRERIAAEALSRERGRSQ